MIALAIQCPSCGLKLRHSARLLSSIAGRRGTTRCPRCRDRIQFDLTSGALELSFPDLYAEPEQLAARVARETAPPDAPSGERQSYVAVKGDAPALAVQHPSLAAPALPKEFSVELTAGTQLFGSDLFGSEQDLFGGAGSGEPAIGTEFDPFADEPAAGAKASEPPMSDTRDLTPLIDAWESGEEAVFPLMIPRRLRR